MWRWPIEWATSKKFWENVASNIVAGSILGLAGLVVVILTGLLPTKESYIAAASFTASVLQVFFFGMAGIAFLVGFSFRNGGLATLKNPGRVAGWTFGLLFVGLTFGILLQGAQIEGWSEQFGIWLWERRSQ